MIEAAAILSGVVKTWDDFTIAVVMLLVNAFLDFLQEHRAVNALRALKSQVSRLGSVRRDGRFIALPVRNLAPGDIIRLKIGDVIPADVMLLVGEYFSVDQSALTGESLPVSRTCNQPVFANSVIKQGEMLAVGRPPFAAIPVALPAVLSVTMAVGALNLARRQAVVSPSLPSRN